MRVLVAGASTQRVCGVRDCAHVLDEPLHDEGVETTIVWTDEPRELPALVAAEARAGYDGVLWHYSPFTYARRGLPSGVPAMARALNRVALPVVVLLHELAPDVRGRGWRGAAQALTQRAALVPILRTADAAIVTAEERVALLRSAWLPRRPVALVAVPSNVPHVAARERHANGTLRVGIFGYRHATLNADLVAESVAKLDGRARLVLVGAPGADTEAGGVWRSAAERHGAAVEFTGELEPDELSDALASLDVVLSPDPSGPAPRRGSLAAALAHGRPVLALAGPRTWQRMRSEGAVVVADRDRFAGELRRLVADDALRAQQGVRGRAFYDRWMTASVAARAIRDVLVQVER